MPTEAAPAAVQRRALVDAGLLVPSGIDGLYGRSAVFESIVAGIEGVVRRCGADQGAAVLRFPPVITRQVLEATGYLRSFPDLIGSISSFVGDDRAHAALLGRADAGDDWTSELVAAQTVLCPSACHPLYPTLPSRLPPGGSRYDVYGWVFRHEPAIDPARMQAFRQYEFVYVGEADGALAHRNQWRMRAATLLGDLGLDVTVEVANDPFFGRLGRMLAANQQDAALKYEVLAPTSSPSTRTAVASANCHGEHFGEAFGLSSADGATAHSACVGFGVERITLALLYAHGLDVRAWPADVSQVLWP